MSSGRVLQFPISKADIEKAVESITVAEVSRILNLADRVWADGGMPGLVAVVLHTPETERVGRAICPHQEEHDDNIELGTELATIIVATKLLAGQHRRERSSVHTHRTTKQKALSRRSRIAAH